MLYIIVGHGGTQLHSTHPSSSNPGRSRCCTIYRKLLGSSTGHPDDGRTIYLDEYREWAICYTSTHKFKHFDLETQPPAT